jgi:hypothetical protein
MPESASENEHARWPIPQGTKTGPWLFPRIGRSYLTFLWIAFGWTDLKLRKELVEFKNAGGINRCLV